MISFSVRKSWDTNIKHLARHGLLNDVLSSEQIMMIPRSNLSRWKNEANNKYQYAELNQIIEKEVDFIKRMNQSSKLKKINESYFKLCDTFHEVISNVKCIQTLLKEQKELIVNTIEKVAGIIPIEKALKVFNISRSTYQNYKSIVIHKCETSYFNWCTKRLPNQLLPSEVKVIKKYMENNTYQFWSKSSVYLKAIRENTLACSLNTFYKYCRLLGFSNPILKRKSQSYNPLKTSHPNQVWCADVTIFKTNDNVKHYIHILIDHYSKKVLAYSIEKNNSGVAIRNLLQRAYAKHRPNQTIFLTDGGSENINTNVSSLLLSWNDTIIHRIAQRDVLFSNSMIEAFNKVLKHQFLHHRKIISLISLEK